ncbi:ATP-dependent RNA helicase DbpA [Alkalimarinus sediminis]|uniref:DEAD-box ATP-dependent RNA helicase RhpA n=1 Tax=Alkalimarinus sediminis TaxID=1632866 RepID=A0A9E8KS02_9ALTE|nr:ATP-dependent RNA helicase DbpA [Alkalimarinus sediminis]UZW76777.1 ATP-dependent RNA helicase DbpA [Alkalimarinus sediminis]
MSTQDFSSLNLPQAAIDNLNSLGYKAMTAIQEQSIPLAFKGHDLIAKAKTGSGKTAAFSLPILNKLNIRFFGVQALILCPTRELSAQVAKEIRRLARYQQNIKVVTLCGGQPIGPQIGSLEHGAHIVVGTPGRIKDHLRKGTLVLEGVSTVVLDEADRMLDMGFYDDIETIIQQTPSKRQTLLFSATYPEKIQQLSSDFQSNPVEITVESVHSHSQIEQIFFQVSRSQKNDATYQLLLAYQPNSVVIFCNTKQACQELTDYLIDGGLSALSLHGDLEQRDRDEVLIRFSNQSVSILVATDVAARGLDIDDLQAVINYDLSRDNDIYTHRIGRTGRAGKKGLALSLYTESEKYKLEAIEDGQKQPIQYGDMKKSDNSGENLLPHPPMTTLCIFGGRKQKVRPGDILGALTGEAGIPGKSVGKIDVTDFSAYVAIERAQAKTALTRILNGKIKGRKFKARLL